MRRLLGLVAALAMLQIAAPALAQNTVAAVTVSACGTPNNSPVVGNSYTITQDTTGKLCTSASGGGGGGGTSSNFGSAFPTVGTAVGFKDSNGTNMVAGNLNAAGALKVDGSAVTQPVSAASLPLPTGAATSANQTGGNQKTQIVDGSGNVITSTSNNLNVQCANCSGSGVSTADEASMTPGTSLFAGSGGFFQTTATSNALTTGQQGMFQVTANRALFTNLRNASGTEVGTSTTPLQVTLASGVSVAVSNLPTTVDTNTGAPGASTLRTVSAAPTTIYSAQKTVSTSASAMTAQALANGLVLTALPTNSAAIYVGPSGVTTSTGYALQPGASISYGVTNASAIFIISAASTTDGITATGN